MHVISFVFAPLALSLSLSLSVRTCQSTFKLGPLLIIGRSRSTSALTRPHAHRGNKYTSTLLGDAPRTIFSAVVYDVN